MKAVISRITETLGNRQVQKRLEQGALGLAALCLLLILIDGGRQICDGYAKTPAELFDAALRVEQRVQLSPWDGAEREKTELVDLHEIAQRRILDAVDRKKYIYTKDGGPLGPDTRRVPPITEPIFLAVQDLQVSCGSAVIATTSAAINEQSGKAVTQKENAAGSESRGVKFVVVRGILPYREQILNLQQALNLDTVSQASESFEIIDFSIQRQKAGRGADPWAGNPWKDMNLETALDFLSEADDFDPEIVREEYTSPVITSPLPARVTGAWSPDLVSHPQLESLLLSAAEQARSNAQQRPVGRQVHEGTPRGRPPEMAKFLLFRFFDTTVEPGDCYRYRVQLVLRNPNFGVRLEFVNPASVVRGETRVTRWSEPSPAVAVEADTDYFLATGRRPGRAFPRGVEFEFFQREERLDTLVSAKLKQIPGQLLGGRTKAECLNVALRRLEEAIVEFHSRDLLVDSAGPPAVNLTTLEVEHSDLGISRAGWDALVERRRVFDTAITIAPSGELQQLDRSAASLSVRDSLLLRLAAERKDFENPGEAGSSRGRLDPSKFEPGRGAAPSTPKSVRARNPLRGTAP